MNRGIRKKTTEMIRLQGMNPKLVQICVKEGMFGKQIGNAMSVNVVERIMGRLFAAAGIARMTPLRDRWESGEAIRRLAVKVIRKMVSQFRSTVTSFFFLRMLYFTLNLKCLMLKSLTV